MSGAPNRFSRAGRAFTLIEVLIAVALLLVLVSISFSFLRQLLGSRDRAMTEAARQLGATVLLDRIEGDLMTCLVGDSGTGAGVVGSANSLTILSRGVLARLPATGQQLLADMQRTEYEVDGGAVRARRQSIVSNGAEAEFWTVAELGKVRFRFHDGSAWSDSFDSLSAGRLPVAVEVAVWFRPWPGGDESGDDADVSDDEDDSSRLTFAETNDAFDEEGFSFESTLPLPNRVRVIAIPDSAAGDDEELEFEPRTVGDDA